MATVEIFYALICALLVYVSIRIWEKYFHRPRVWVLDDSKIDTDMFKLKVKLDGCDVRYFSSAKGISNAYAKAVASFNDPSCVIIDYYLDDKVRGDEVRQFFKNNGVKSVIITGYKGEISNITERDIIRKTHDDSYYRRIEEWVLNATGLKA